MLRPGLISRRGGEVVVPSWSPPDVAGLVGWWKADAIGGLSDGDPVATWEDSHTSNRDLAQATGSKKPTYKTNILSGKAAVRFDGTDDYLDFSGAAFLTGTACTLAVVHIRRAPTTSSRLVACHNSARTSFDYDHVSQWLVYGESTGTETGAYRNGQVTRQTGISNDVAVLSLFWFDGTNGNQRHNGAAASPTASGGSTGTFNVDHLIVGAGFDGGAVSRFCQDDICEIVLWDNDIGSTERTNLEAYTDRWGL